MVEGLRVRTRSKPAANPPLSDDDDAAGHSAGGSTQGTARCRGKEKKFSSLLNEQIFPVQASEPEREQVKCWRCGSNLQRKCRERAL